MLYPIPGGLSLPSRVNLASHALGGFLSDQRNISHITAPTKGINQIINSCAVFCPREYSADISTRIVTIS
jgi:hypothetical protein